ncbi:putative glucan endo-1-3-beta-glucosidase [Nymphaea thermarum]|nr:putative glucan endo-1-3-beta-glucosidase [Nymphaea thermarum]
MSTIKAGRSARCPARPGQDGPAAARPGPTPALVGRGRAASALAPEPPSLESLPVCLSISLSAPSRLPLPLLLPPVSLSLCSFSFHLPLLLLLLSPSPSAPSPFVSLSFCSLSLPSPSPSLVSLSLSAPSPFQHIALCKTSLKVSIMVPNQAIVNISASERTAHTWVRTNLLPFYRHVRIRTLLVGNEVLSDHAKHPTWFHLVPAMHNIKLALASLCIRNVKVDTTFAMDTLESSFPLSRGTFRRDIAVPVVLPLLKFLSKTRSSFFLDIYPCLV